MKKNIYKLLSLPALLLAPGLLAAGNPAQQSAADTAGYRDIYPDTWVATTPWDARCLLTKRSEP